MPRIPSGKIPEMQTGGRSVVDFAHILLALLPSFATGVAGYLAAAMRRRTKEERATAKVIKALARKEIMDAYELYVAQGRHMTVERLDQLTEVFEAYTALGGNGSAKRMYEQTRATAPWVVTD